MVWLKVPQPLEGLEILLYPPVPRANTMDLFGTAAVSASGLAIAHDLFTMQRGVLVTKSCGEHCKYGLIGSDPETLAKGR